MTAWPKRWWPGAWLLASLRRFGVDTADVVQTAGGGTTSVALVADDGRRAIVSQPLAFDWSALDVALARPGGGRAVLYVDGYRAREALDRARRARAKGLVTAADLDGCDAGDWSALARFADAFDVLFLNRGLAERIGGPPDALAARFVAAGAAVACVTLGSAGVNVATTEGSAHIGAFDVAVRDTTGAGEVFVGAFLHRYLAGGGQAPLPAAPGSV